MPLILGIDIGGTKIAGGIVDGDAGRVLLQDRVPTFAAEGGPAVLRRALDLAKSLLAAADAQSLPRPEAIGIGAGGQIDPETGTVVFATEVLPGWTGTPLKAAFEDAFGLPTAADNDVNALAVGEGHFGSGRGYRNLLYLALGTGVGGAIIMDGKLYHGTKGAGGELGHLVLIPDGLSCTCGGRGCLEQYANGASLVRYFREMGGVGLAAIEGASIARMARQDPDGVAAHAIARCGRMLGLGLVSLANIFGPDRIIIGGGMADLGDLLLEPTRRILARRALPGVRDCPVVPAALGADASVIGAAALIMS